MTHFISMNQLTEFLVKKIHEEEADPRKAKANETIIQELLKKYANKRLIHVGKNAIAPTTEQWKNIMDYHKGKLLHYRTHPTLSARGKKPNSLKIKEHENKISLAKRMYQWAREFEEENELRKLSSILVMKPAEKKVTFNESLPSDGTTGIYPINPENEQQRSTIAHGHDTRLNRANNPAKFSDYPASEMLYPASDLSRINTDEDSDEKDEMQEKRRRLKSKLKKHLEQYERQRQKTSIKGKRWQSSEDIPRADGGWYPSSTTSLDGDPNPKQYKPEWHLHKTTYPYSAPPSYVPREPMLDPKLISPPPPLTPLNTHKVMGGQLSLQSLSTDPVNEKLNSLQMQMNALTQIVETDMTMKSLERTRPTRRNTSENYNDVSETCDDIEHSDDDVTSSRKEGGERLNNSPQRAEKSPNKKLTFNDPYDVFGNFTGMVDENEFENALIRGTVDPTQLATERRAAVYPLRTTGTQMVYQPFTLKDWSSLMLQMPKLTKGGLPWMRALLKQTAGDKLCWGDIYAALTKAADETTASNFRMAVENKLPFQLQKNVPLHNFRIPLEEELKSRYPCIITDELMSLQMKKDEDYYTYKQRAKDLYHDCTGEAIRPGTGITVMFYSALVKGLPRPVQEALDDVMGLYTKTDEDFDQYCNHHVNKWLNNKTDADTKKQELELATIKLQLQKLQTDLKEKKKEKTPKIMAVQQDSTEENETITESQLTAAVKMMMQAQQQQPMTTPQPMNQQAQPTPPPPAPVVIYNTTPNANTTRGRGWHTGSGRRSRRDRGPNMAVGRNQCFSCGGVGHWTNICPMKNQRQQQQQRYDIQQNPQPAMQPMMQQPMGVPLPPVQNSRMMNVGSNYQGGRDTHGCFNEYGDC